MVSGLVTSPWDQLLIFSGDAREMRIESKSAIKFARSYGEDLKIASSSKNRLAPDEHGSQKIRILIRVYPRSSVAHSCFSPPPAPCPALHAASSSTPHRDTTIATRVSVR